MFKYFIILAIFLSLSANATETCYTRTYQLLVATEPKELYESATDTFEILEQDKEKIKFHLITHGYGYSTCEVYGYAYLDPEFDGKYTFLDEKKYWYENELSDLYGQEGSSCKIVLKIKEQKAEASSDGNCMSFCGARAGFQTMPEKPLLRIKSCK